METKVKVFSSNRGFAGLEEAINLWLTGKDLDIVDTEYTDNNAYASCLLFYRNPMIVQLKEKRILKYATGQVVPAGAKYLATVPNGTMSDPNRPADYKYVWHYFLVEVEPE